jgi:hypothetical protein
MRQQSSASPKSQADIGFAGVANGLFAPFEFDETLRNNC